MSEDSTEACFNQDLQLKEEQLPQLKLEDKSTQINNSNEAEIDLLIENTQYKKITISDYFFDFGQHKLNEFNRKQLEAKLLQISFKDIDKIIITGHTDNIGNKSFNLELSRLRANEIASLLKKPNIEIEIKGKGASEPLNNNSNEIERQKNRRVEVIFQMKK